MRDFLYDKLSLLHSPHPQLRFDLGPWVNEQQCCTLKHMTQPNYFEAMDYPAMVQDYGKPEDFLSRFGNMSSDELRSIQNQRFLEIVEFAWQVPFYQRLWHAHGVEPGEIQSLDDIIKLPCYSKADLMQSVEAHPPLGDFDGRACYSPEKRPPLLIQTTTGTTGKPQPLLYGPQSREMQGLLLARVYRLQGITENDVVHSVYGHGMVNGGHYIRETFLHWVGSQFHSAGTGIETRSEQQLALIKDFSATVLVGFGDYLKYLANLATEKGLDPVNDLKVRALSGHMGTESPKSMSSLWGGADVYDWYGVGDTGIIAGEGPDHAGLHVLEDAQFLEILDVDSGTPVAHGESGDMVCTCLYKKDVFPIIRFNTHDVSKFESGNSALDLPFRRIRGFLGRSDNMVKLRGINIFPTGLGAILTENFKELGSEYICEVTREHDRDQMTVYIETAAVTSATNDDANQKTDSGVARQLAENCSSLLKTRTGVDIDVKLVSAGDLTGLTQIETRQKPIRLLDKRKDDT